MQQSLRARYRAWYSSLPPGAQMIGLQLWMPVFFALFYCFCYVYAFHAPNPHNMPVAYVGSGSQASAAAEALTKSTAGMFDVHTVTDETTAVHDVRDGTYAAAYVPVSASSTKLVIASASSYTMASYAKGTFSAIAAASHTTLTVDDLAPLPPHDSFGTTLFYLSLLWTIVGYMTGMFVGMMGAALTQRIRFGVLGAVSVVLAGLSSVIARFLLHAVTAHFWELWGIGVLTAFAVGTLVSALGYFFGRFVTGAAMLLFVFANIPASGGAYPPEFVPQPFRALHPIVSGTGTLEMLRSVVYNVGPGAGAGFVVLVCYFAAGVILIFLGKRFFQWKASWRTARGAPLTMMMSAQRAAMVSAGVIALDDEPSRRQADDETFGAAAPGQAETDAIAAITE